MCVWEVEVEEVEVGGGRAMETQAGDSCEDVRRSGYLRKQKSMHRRYFVLRAASERGPARLEYYESEKKFRGKAPVPKKAVALETCFNINKRADAKNKHMIVLYTRAESFALAAESEADQDEWYQAMVDLQCKSKCTCAQEPRARLTRERRNVAARASAERWSLIAVVVVVFLHFKSVRVVFLRPLSLCLPASSV